MRTPIVKSAARVLDLLELLSAASRPLRLSEVAPRLGIPKTSAFALLSTLVAKGYAEEHGGGYRLVERLQDRGWVGGDVANLVRVSRVVMGDLTHTTGESAFLGVMTAEREVLYLEKALSPNPVRYDTDLEQPRAAYCTSIGLVLLADMADADLDSYFQATKIEAKTPRTETDPAAIRATIARARGQKYVHTVDSHFEGVAGVAAAIRGPSERALAGLAVIGPTARFNPSLAAHAEAVKAAAERIATALSGREMPESSVSRPQRKAG
jgi:DNA-binding IclR family transcriptional regulator